jgi:hypothetical protein
MASPGRVGRLARHAGSVGSAALNSPARVVLTIRATRKDGMAAWVTAAAM